MLKSLIIGLTLVLAQEGGKAGLGGKAGMGGAGVPSAQIWTLVQHPNNFTCTALATGSTQTFSCTVTLTQNTTAGNGLIMLAAISGAATVGPTFSSASGDSTWTHCPAQRSSQPYNATSTESVTVDCAYLVAATGGASSATYVWTGTYTSGTNLNFDVEVLEIHRSSGTAVFDACTSGGGCISGAAGTSIRVSPSCPTTGASDYVAQWISDSENIVSITGPYTSPAPDIDNSDVEAAFAGAINQAAAPAQIWTTADDTPVDGGAMACVAFK